MHPKSFARLRVFIDFVVKLTKPPKGEKINLWIVACFSRRFKTAHLTTIHHESTTKTPHKKRTFSQNPPQKRLKTDKKAPATAGAFLFQNPQFSRR
jgi:hypothetical protein